MMSASSNDLIANTRDILRLEVVKILRPLPSKFCYSVFQRFRQAKSANGGFFYYCPSCLKK